MTRYEQYKDSGIEWIGDIPSHWDITKLKHGAEVVLGKMLTNEDKGDYILKPYLRSANISWFKPDVDEVKEMWFSRDELQKLKVTKGDLLMSEGGEVGRTCIWNDELPECYIQNSVHKISCREGLNPKYLLYLLCSYGYRGAFDSIVNRISIAHLTYEKVREIKMFLPSIKEQRFMVKYLDYECNTIEKGIKKKRQLIDLLNEEKAAVINHAITKGVNAAAPLRPSGIDWLGDIPAHWDVKPLKHVSSKIGDGIHATPNYVDASNIYFVNGNNLNDGIIEITDRTNRVDNEEYLKHKIDLKLGTILYSINGTIGNIAFYNNEKIILGKSAAFIECSDMLNNEFLYWILQCSYVEYYFFKSLSGTTINNLSLYTIRNLKAVLPPYEEQTAIVATIKENIRVIDAAIHKIEKEIDLLTEYKTSLIYEVVTGKVKVDAPVEEPAAAVL